MEEWARDKVTPGFGKVRLLVIYLPWQLCLPSLQFVPGKIKLATSYAYGYRLHHSKQAAGSNLFRNCTPEYYPGTVPRLNLFRNCTPIKFFQELNPIKCFQELYPDQICSGIVPWRPRPSGSSPRSRHERLPLLPGGRDSG